MSNLGNAQELGFSKSRCKTFTGKFEPEPGEKFGEWTIIGKAPDYRYKVECSCGVVTTVCKHALRRKDSTMCSACAMKERRKQRHKGKSYIIGGKI